MIVRSRSTGDIGRVMWFIQQTGSNHKLQVTPTGKCQASTATERGGKEPAATEIMISCHFAKKLH